MQKSIANFERTETRDSVQSNVVSVGMVFLPLDSQAGTLTWRNAILLAGVFEHRNGIHTLVMKLTQRESWSL